MAGKKEKTIKNKRPMAGWAVCVLKFTQHLSFSVAVICCIALILLGSVYVEANGGYRIFLQIGKEDSEEKAKEYLLNHLPANLYDAIRLATIRSQLETDGKFDSKKVINISEYYYRKNESINPAEKIYFEKALYELEDLIRWQQSGGLTYLDTAVKINSNIYSSPVENASVEINITGTGNSEQAPLLKNDRIGFAASNMFYTVNGLRLENLVSTEAEYMELCRQLESCMFELYSNYVEYKNYMRRFAEGETSFVYYIKMDNEAGDVYTNMSILKDISKQSDLNAYFSNLVCAGAGSTALYYDIDGEFALSQEQVLSAVMDFDYAFGDSAVIYAGYDIHQGVQDIYQEVWNAYSAMSYSMDAIYVLLSILCICVLYYCFLTIYLLVSTGRKVDREGQEYIELRWNDQIYSELFLAWCTALGVAISLAVFEIYEYFSKSSDDYISIFAVMVIAGGSFLLSLLTMEALCSLVRRLKAGILFKNSILYKVVVVQVMRFVRYIKRSWNEFTRNMQLFMIHSSLWKRTWGVFITEMLFCFFSLIAVIILVAARESLLAFCVGSLMLLVRAMISFKRVRGKLEREDIIDKIEGIAAGESMYVEEEPLSVENAALGHAVNEIGEGIRVAVEKSTKDERLKAELLTNVSHDIKTPLTSIINYVDLLKKENIESSKAKEYIEVLENKSHKLKNLIQDLIEVSKISTGNIEYEMVPINLHELIMQALAEYDEKFEEHCLKLVYNNSVKEAVIMADSRRMWRVMENLLSNIYKYALEGTRVYVEVIEREDEITFTIKNISAKEIRIQSDELTERFVRGDISRTTEGSGLGLAIAQNLVIGQDGIFKIMLDGDLFKVAITFKRYCA